MSFEILDHKAPYLIDKLIRNCIVENAEEGEHLFTEVKRWMLLSRLDRSRYLEMYSLRIDETWHQFILYTREYTKFCNDYFGSYFPHAPANSPGNIEKENLSPTSFDEFKQLYETTFKNDLPEVWYDEQAINLNRRIFNDNTDKIFLTEQDGTVQMRSDDAEIICSLSSQGKEAAEFIVSTRAFYVRELPGDITNKEKVMLISALVQYNILRVAP